MQQNLKLHLGPVEDPHLRLALFSISGFGQLIWLQESCGPKVVGLGVVVATRVVKTGVVVASNVEADGTKAQRCANCLWPRKL